MNINKLNKGDKMLEKLFKLKENNTNVKTEVIAGITTFMTMAYILAVNPNILSATGMDANAILIGYNAQTLNALQFITSLIVNQYFDRETETGLIVKVDVGDYRKSRDEKLEKLAVRVGREVAKTKIAVKLRPMNAYERKVIHNKLSDWRDVQTHSEGVEPKRYIVVEPKVK